MHYSARLPGLPSGQVKEQTLLGDIPLPRYGMTPHFYQKRNHPTSYTLMPRMVGDVVSSGVSIDSSFPGLKHGEICTLQLKTYSCEGKIIGKHRERSRHMSWGSLAASLLRVNTTDILSQKKHLPNVTP